jgi:menaquinone-dependent protoporphyrinogen oxidase
MRVLVVYGSTRGGTAGLAHMVADALARHRIGAEVRPAGDVRVLEDADAVIVGGALYSNRWHPDAVAFVGRHRAALRQLPVWYFSSGPLDDSARSGAFAAVSQVSALAREVDIRGHMTFGGLLDKKPSGLFGRFTWGPEGDFRDSRHVSEWVERIAVDLHGQLDPMVRVIEDPAKPVSPKEPALPSAPASENAYDRVFLSHARPVDVRSEQSPAVESAVAAPDNELESVLSEPARSRRLRRYLRLDDDSEDDEGLDLFGDHAEV